MTVSGGSGRSTASRDPVAQLLLQPRVAAALSDFQRQLPTIVRQIVAIQQISAPTFMETRRSRYLARRFAELGLSAVERDSHDNVFGCLPATLAKSGSPPLVVSAHIDSVFPAGTDLSARHGTDLVYGPGIGDNAAGAAGLLVLAETMQTYRLELGADVWFVANVAEEGMGDLRGMRAVVDRFGPAATYIVVEGGMFGQISHQAISVRRFRVSVTAPGGHSWGDFGRLNAIHELAHIIAAIDELAVPGDPKTTFNVGTVAGGHSVNSIAASAFMLLDLRSEDARELSRLERSVRALIHSRNVRNGRRSPSVDITMQLVGDRPCGQIQPDAPLVQWARAALQAVGCTRISHVWASTDANIPLSEGSCAVCIGLTVAGATHTVEEFIDPSYLPQGLGQLLLLVLAAAGSGQQP